MTDKEGVTGHPAPEFSEFVLTRMVALTIFEKQVLLARGTPEQAARHLETNVTTLNWYRQELERKYGLRVSEITRHFVEFRRRRRVQRTLWVPYKERRRPGPPPWEAPETATQSPSVPLTEAGIEQRARIMKDMPKLERRLIDGWLEGMSYASLGPRVGIPANSVAYRFSNPKGIFALLDLQLKSVDHPQEFRKHELRLIRDRCRKLQKDERLEPA